jgi:pilus assembly protein CpaB
MNRNRMMMGLGFALVVALLLSAFVYQQFQKAAAANTVPMVQIVVAAKPIALGTKLDASMLRAIPWPASDAIAGACTKVQDCTNRALITSVAQNEPIIESKLAPTAAGAGLAATIPDGMRAMSVAVNDVVGVAGFVTPGTVVDVLVTGAIAGEGGKAGGQSITRTILENVRVLAAGQQIQQDQQGKPEKVPVITLLVTPEQAGKLAMASSEGKIQLALRNATDRDLGVPPPILQTALFASGAPASAPAPVKHVAVRKEAAPPPAPYQVEVIMGDKRETKNFANQ